MRPNPRRAAWASQRRRTDWILNWGGRRLAGRSAREAFAVWRQFVAGAWRRRLAAAEEQEAAERAAAAAAVRTTREGLHFWHDAAPSCGVTLSYGAGRGGGAHRCAGDVDGAARAAAVGGGGVSSPTSLTTPHDSIQIYT